MTTAEYIRQYPIKEFRKGEILLHGGEPSSVLLAVRSGFIKIVSYSNDGGVNFLWITGKYDIVPTEHLFLLARPLEFFYVALTDVSVYKVSKTDYLRDVRTNTALLTDTAIGMSTHYDDLLARISAMEQPSVKKRLLATLCHIAERFSVNESVDLAELGLILTHQDLAEMINSTRETTTLELQKLRHDNCIEYSRSAFTVHLARCRILLDSIQ